MLLFCADKHQSFLQVGTVLFDGCGQACLKNYLHYLKKDVIDEAGFLHTDKYQSFLQVDTFFLMAYARYAQSTQTSLQYLCDISRRKPGVKVIFLHAGKHQSFP